MGISLRFALLLLGLLGAIHAIWVCGSILWLADSTIWAQPPGDIAAGLIGAEAYLRDEWHWPLAATARLLSDSQPISIAYTDSLPVLMILLKLLGAIPAIAPPFGIAILVGQVLQPAAAGWALYRAGVRHSIVLLPGALLVAWMPAWYFRLLAQHLPLTWHWLILAALGLAFGWCKAGRVTLHDGVGAILLCMVGVATHVYLGINVLALSLVGCLVLLRARKYLPAAAFGAILVASSAGTAVAVGLLPPPDAGVSMGRFASPPGHYSFNLLAPIDFSYSTLWPSARPIDSTGGQYEGMAYLGFGVLVLAGLYGLTVIPRGLFAGIQLMRSRSSGARTRSANTLAEATWQLWPLVAVLLGLTAFAALPNVWLGRHILISFPIPPPVDLLLEQIRSGGRMIWPLIYAIVIALVAGVAARTNARFAGLLVTGVLVLQVADTATLRDRIRSMIHATPTPPGTFRELRAAGALQGDVRLRPSWFCVDAGDRELAQAIAANVVRRGGTLHQPPLARGAMTDCGSGRVAGQPLPNVQDVFFRGSLALHDLVATYRRRLCDPIGSVLICEGLRTTGELPEREAFVALMPTWDVVVGKRYPVTRDKPVAQWLYLGWSGPEPWGTWTEGNRATVLIPFPKASTVRAITLELMAYSGRPPYHQKVRISVGGKLAWQGQLSAGAVSTIQVPVDIMPLTSNIVPVDFAIEQPQSPKDNGQSSDSRLLGIGLLAITLDGSV